MNDGNSFISMLFGGSLTLTSLLAILKIIDVLYMSWLVVLAPLFAALGIFGILFVIAGFYGYIIKTNRDKECEYDGGL